MVFNCGGLVNWGGYGGIMMVLYTLILIGIVVLLYLWIAKLWKETSRRK